MYVSYKRIFDILDFEDKSKKCNFSNKRQFTIYWKSYLYIVPQKIMIF